jgi:choline dehydrogenase-like flavoprotein
VLAALAAGILGPAYDPAVPGRMLEILGGTASRRDRERLYVADASLFPTASGVNPMLSVMALAHRAAAKLAAHLA